MLQWVRSHLATKFEPELSLALKRNKMKVCALLEELYASRGRSAGLANIRSRNDGVTPGAKVLELK
jgi:hypothetical protein